MRQGVALAMSALLLTGCGTMQPIVSAKGPDAGTANKAIAFKTVADAAKTDPDRTREMLDRGYELIQADCDDYFRSAGENQFNVNFGRDFAVATATIVTSGMLYNPRNKKAVGVIPLIGGAVYTGMDVYNKNFLFNAENIDAVKTLVMNAVATHQEASLRDLGEDLPTYGDVLVMLQEDQAYCMPPKIVPMVRTAIKNGEVVQVSPSAPPVSDKRTPAEVTADDAVLKALGTDLNPPGTLSLEQATALYWLFKSDTTADERKALYKTLASLPAGSQPLNSSGAFTAGWSHQATVEAELAKLSAPSVAKMRAAIAEFRAALKRQAQAQTEMSNTVTFNALSPALKDALQLEASQTLQFVDGPAASPRRGRRPVVVDVK